MYALYMLYTNTQKDRDRDRDKKIERQVISFMLSLNEW
jgi:hypothetical protein